MRRKRRVTVALVAFFALVHWGRLDALAQEKPPADKQTTEKETGDKETGDKQADVLAGHSYHGEVFNEGPRQKAYLMKGTGNVHFPITTKDARVQEFFDQGVGQLHGYWYFEAERTFRQAAAIDPDCAMAYWGMAMANIYNQKRARGFIDEALERRKGISRREELWLDGYATYLKADSKKNKQRRREYIRSLEEILHEFPDDLEAKAFLVVRLWQFKRNLPIPSYQAVDALLDQIFAVEPRHPAHHYRIHLWDYEKPERALTSAARSGQASPSIAHMWHMGGHTYSRLKRYADSAWQQEASARVDHAQMVRDRVLPDQIHNFAHNNEWLIRNLSHIGRVRDAMDLARNMIELPRHPRYNTLAKRGRSASYGRRRLFEILERYELWNDLIGLCHTMYLEPTEIPDEQVKRLRTLGVAYYGVRNLSKLEAQVAALKARQQQEEEEKNAAVAEAEKKVGEEEAEKKAEETSGEETATKTEEKAGEEAGTAAEDEAGKKARKEREKKIEKTKKAAARDFDRRIDRIERVLTELEALESLLRGDRDVARERLEKVRGLSKERRAVLYLEAGDGAKADGLAREAVESAPGQVVPLATRAYVLHELGNLDEAAKVMEELLANAAHIDIDAPAFRRLAPLIRELGLDPSWKLVVPGPDDVGERPDLDSLGPFRWHPPPAPAWTLPDPDGKPISLEEYRGRTVVVIFYLGYGCLHCVEQLQSFGPKTAAFEKRGISIVAISTDPLEDLKKSLVAFQEEKKFPFPIVSNSELDIFKAYRAYDDFENQTLHGTYLIDADGRVLWQDISYEPFTDPDFLLKEAERLLGKRVGRVGYF